ncbi:MAG: nodulation protein NfeD [Aquificaceae bacterium]
MRVILLTLLVFSISLVKAASNKVFVVSWQGAVSPLMVDHLSRAISLASKEGASALVLELNTPGGLEKSTREIVQQIQNSPVPVVVFVYPPGGRAASAGAIITVCADVAAMAPGTNIGAAMPVGAGGEEIEKTAREKLIQDILAMVRGITSQKGRNSSLSEEMITKGTSLTSEEALKEKVIDLIASDTRQLVSKLDGIKVKKPFGEITISIKNPVIIPVEKTLRENILSTLADPTLAYFLLMIGFYGILFELYSPGSFIPGTIGVISLLIGLYGLGIIGVNWLGLLLFFVGLGLIALELFTPTYGILAVFGAIGAAIGSALLVSSDSPYGDVPLGFVLALLLSVLVFVFIAGKLGLRAQSRQKMLGSEDLLNQIAVAQEDFSQNRGKVFVRGELWDAKLISDAKVSKGQELIIIGIEGMTLLVKPR